MKAAMTERMSSWDPVDLKARGVPSRELINLYRRWGEGGFGLILTGNIMMEYDQLEAQGNPIIPTEAPFSGERFEAFRELGALGKKHGSLIVGQVSHPGRQVCDAINTTPISASDVQLTGSILGMHFAKPRPASKEDLARVIEGFAHAAEYLERAGYDGIQLHGAHGYLLAQFLSETTNLRTDEYGGSIENRARLITEVAAEIRKRVRPEFVIGIKLNSVEFQEKGFQPEEARKLCAILEANRFDFVELSGGTYESLAFVHKRDSTRKREAFFLDFAEQVAPALTKTKSYIVGGLKTAGAMARALDTVDGVAMARATTQEPHFPRDVLEGRVKGVIKQRVDQDDFARTHIVAGSQMLQIGKDHEPIDMSRPENVETFDKDLAAWKQKMGDNKDERKYGYADLDHSPVVPYGTAAA